MARTTQTFVGWTVEWSAKKLWSAFGVMDATAAEQGAFRCGAHLRGVLGDAVNPFQLVRVVDAFAAGIFRRPTAPLDWLPHVDLANLLVCGLSAPSEQANNQGEAIVVEDSQE